ncbi:hypothetical protein ZYGR_0A03830 [Zygosaccharomyces rouxii]|uniref:ZYRO0A08668p n=2 Tax=Zygosaccharomyces rouxii TaxID=4956 RepID=C5DQ51_ZYGRC|nr:uncharacterized protein ZYRO0A08668g [Zygosaccharomyces rouxii]KAH9198669.1 hypothetical protein LQ764DRAFT_235668 [Zygosaccharomyces rouxii]GAV46787.1 hypothetical protein ZYGR_0A03830 [Zygosaccharomyces rouxii]CAR25812.1 ZYRO0A08668p [Zygosaccharomyces rouxii]
MVYVYESKPIDTFDSHFIISGRDQFENDLLIKYGFREWGLIWFHTDKYSSGHIYLKLLPHEKSLDDVPDEVLQDCLQLCKSNSIQGNKLGQCKIITTPWHNLRKSGFMKPGEVSYKSTKNCKKFQCYERNQKLLNRLCKTRVELYDAEPLLHQAKKEKDACALLEYVEANHDKLIEEEKLRKREKKLKKRNPDKEDELVNDQSV